MTRAWNIVPGTSTLSSSLMAGVFLGLALLGCQKETVPPPQDTSAVLDTVNTGDSDTEPTKTWLSPPIGETLCLAGLPRRGSFQELAVGHLAELGIERVRMDILWHRIESEKGSFDFSSEEAALRPYLSAGIEVLGLLCYGTAWASSATEDDHHFPPDDPEDFANFVAKTIEYFGKDIRVYEIWNEPNAGFRFWKPDLNGDPVAYGALLKAAVKSGREACSDCTFLFGSPFFHSQLVDGHIPFLTKAQEAHPDLSDAYDVMGFHPYPLYPPQAAPEGPPPEVEWAFEDMVSGVREVLAQQDAQDKPMWATEFGWPVFGEVDDEIQAAFLVRGILRLLALGTETACWYNLYEGDKPKSFPPEDAFGLLTRGDPDAGIAPTPKPAFFALSQLGNRFKSFRVAHDLATVITLPEHAYGYALENADGEKWWVVWQHAAETPPEMTLPASPLEALSMTGEELTIKTLTLPLSEYPVFLRMPQP